MVFVMNHIESLRKHIDNGTLIRGKWKGYDAQGRETACLLAAMVPQCGIDESARACPAEVMPSWLARITPSLDDSGSLAAWPGMVTRYADLAGRWHSLDSAAWQRVQYTFLAAVVREAAGHTKDETVTAVCERVAVLCDGVVTSGVIDAASFEEAELAAWAAACSAAEAAEAARAARAAARAAAWAAACSAAGGAWAAATTVAEAARAAAEWDRMTVALFDAIEKECK